MTTYSINDVMAAIGYLNSPDNEETLLAEIHEAKICGAVGVDFHPFVDRLVNDEGAYDSGGDHRITEAGRATLIELFGPDGTFVATWNAWNRKRLGLVQPLTPASKGG